MRIAQLAGWYSPTSGGIRTVVGQLGSGYRQAGHSTLLIVPGERTTVHADRLELRAPLLPGDNGYRFLIRRQGVVDALNRFGPDVLEVHDKLWLPLAARWAKRHGIAVVVFTHERLDVTLPLLLGKPVRVFAVPASRWIRSAVSRHADVVVACSAFAAAEFPGARRVPLGVDLQTFAPRPAAAFGKVRLVMASRLSAEKRPDLSIDALAVLQRRGVDAELAVVGVGPMQDRLRTRAAGLPVRFLGYVADRGALARVLATADVALAPGPAETFGLSALEALACGTPVVAIHGAAVAELLPGAPAAGRGVPADPTAIADAVMELRATPADQRRRAARAIAERHPWSATVAAMLAIHESSYSRSCSLTNVTAH